MGRKRDSRLNDRLPTYVYRRPKVNAVEYRPYYGKGKFGASVYLKDRDGKNLRADATQDDIIKSYYRTLKDEEDHGKALSWLFNRYFRSPRHMKLAVRTKKDYEWYADKIIAMEGKNGSKFGDFPFEKITRKVVAGLRDKLADHPTQANRRLQFISAVFSWAVEEEYMSDNPAKGVSKFSIESRDRYADDTEYQIVYDSASDYPFLQIMMELAYLCRARMSELRNLPSDAPNDIGVYLKRSKKSESEITTWTPRLRAAIDAAKALHPVPSRFLIHNEDGSRITENQFRNAWRRTIDKALKEGLKERFTFHDLKARGITNHPLQWGGHKSERMKQVYVRQAKKITATE